jgi:hypothetical protein
MATIDEQIKANNAKIEANNAKISALKASGAEWLSQSKVGCGQGSPSKQAACMRDKQWKKAQSNARFSEAKVLEGINEGLLADNTALTRQRAQEGQAIVNLSNQGLTPAVLQTKATAEAEAARLVAEAQGRAINTKATAEANTTAADGKTKMIITVVIVIVVLVIASVVVVKKLKKSN